MSEIETRRSPADPASSASAGHNGGPPLDEEHRPEWGNGGIGNYFYWKAAHRSGLEKPLARHRRVSHPESRTAGPHLRRIHVGNSRTRPSPADRGCRTDCRDQAGARRPCGHRSEQHRNAISFARSHHSCRISRSEHCNSSPDTCAMLSEMLVETVANGGSVSFMHPLPLQAAKAFWRNSLGFGRPRRADRSRRL